MGDSPLILVRKTTQFCFPRLAFAVRARRALKNSVYLFFGLPNRNIDEAFVSRVVGHAHDSFTIGDQMNIKRILACLAISALLAGSTATSAIADVVANAGETPAGVENTPEGVAKAEAVALKTFAIGWRDNGQVPSHAIISGGSARIVGQREFKLGVGGWDVSSPRPCVRIIGYGDGGTGADQSCSPW